MAYPSSGPLKPHLSWLLPSCKKPPNESRAQEPQALLLACQSPFSLHVLLHFEAVNNAIMVMTYLPASLPGEDPNEKQQIVA